MFRLVCELRPRWVLVENVPALRTRGADRVLGDLESEGYTCWPFVVGADDVGAPHRRKRVWIVAHCDGRRREGEREPQPAGVERAPGRDADGRDGARVGDAARGGLGVGGGSSSPRSRGDSYGADARVALASGARREEPGREHARALAAVAPPSWPARPGQQQHAWEPPRVVPGAQRGLGQHVDGLPARVVSAHRRARLKALGNSVVPAVVEAIGRAIIAADQGMNGS